MRCNCCDRLLNPKEISYNEEIEAFELCGTCLDAAIDAAFPSGYKETVHHQLVDPLFDTEEPIETLFISLSDFKGMNE